MVQIFPEHRASKSALGSPDMSTVEYIPRLSQPKRPRISTNPPKKTSEAEYYVTISLLGDGPPQIKSSTSLKPYKDHIVGGALTRFLDCISDAKAESISPGEAQQSLAQPTMTSTQPEAPSISYPFARRAKRRRSNSSVTPTPLEPADNGQDEDSDTVSHTSEKLKVLRMGNREECREFFLLGFQAIQQIDCRFLAKRWIKKIEPKKQVHHPYNGGKREPKDPATTKPQWWPVGMTHKEPDHINKTDRITLLTHLIMHTGTDLLISLDTGSAPMVQDLEEVTKPHVLELKNPKSWSILQEMFSVRRYMELVEFEGNDPEMYHKMVVDRSSDTRRAQGEPRHVIEDDDSVDCPEPQSADAHKGGRPNLKVELISHSSTLSSPVAETHLSKDHQMHGMDDQDCLPYDMAPPARMMVKAHYSGPLSLAYDDIPSHHPNPHSIPHYESPTSYVHGQPLQQQLYQRTDGSIPGLHQRADFAAVHSSQPGTMSHWLATGPLDFCFPTQYQGLPSGAPAMQTTADEQPLHDGSTYQVHQHDPNQAMHYSVPMFDHQPTHPAFSEAHETSTPRWSHLAYRPASHNHTPLSHISDMPLLTGSDQLYQPRLRELSEFE